MENTENKLEIWGSGREFLIGTLTEDEAERIKDDEALEEILEDVDEADDVLHIYGPDIDEVVLKHQDEEVTFKHFSFVLEPTWEFRDDFEEYLNEQISEYLEEEMGITAEHDFKNDFQELTNKLQEKPEEKIFLINDEQLNDSQCRHYNKRMTTFFYPTSIDPHKNISRLISAWNILATSKIKAKLEITISDEYLHKINKDYANPNIVSAGFISEDDVLCKIKNCDYLIYPSLIESYP